MGDRIVVMKDGLVQQVGTPLELYRRPANRFVASFIGSPAMNFIDMAVAAGGDSFRLSADGIAIELPQRRFAGLGAHAGAHRDDGRAAAAPAARDRPTAASMSASAAT